MARVLTAIAGVEAISDGLGEDIHRITIQLPPARIKAAPASIPQVFRDNGGREGRFFFRGSSNDSSEVVCVIFFVLV
jgi:hypothetical protein